MASGLLYSNVQPNTIQPHWLQIMESDRERRNMAHAKEADRMAKERAELFDGIKDVDAEGAFLEQSVGVMNEARRHMVDLWKQKEDGKISEEQFLLNKARIESMPDQINAAYQAHEAKMGELVAGDPKLNFYETNGLTQFGVNSKLQYDPEKGVMINSSYTDRNGTSINARYGVGEHINKVNGIRVIPDQGDPNAIALKFGTDFKADEIQNGRHTTKGLDTGESLKRFNTSFEGSFGNREARDNELVKKWMVSDNPELDTYEEAYDSLYNIAKSNVAEIDKRTPTPEKSTSTKSPTADLDKMNWNVFTDEIDVDGEKIAGKGATFALSDAAQKVDIDINTLGDIPKDIADQLKVNAIHVTPDGDMYVKGTVVGKNKDVKKLEALKSGFSKDGNKDAVDIIDKLAKAKEGRKISTEWIKLSGEAKSQVISNVTKGKDGLEMYDYLGGEKVTEETKKPTAEELIAKYSK